MNSEITAVEYNINKLSFSSYLYQYAVTVSATLLLASGAITIGWSSPTIPKLLAEDSPIPITIEQSSWLASIVVIGATIAPLPAAFMMDRLGRKTTLLINAIPIFIGWLLMAYGNSIEILYASRILNGLSFGISFCVTPIYLSEIASYQIRGSLIVFTIVMAKFGILYAYAIAPYVSVRAMAFIAMIPLLIFIVTFVWLPESPYHLIENGNDELAIKNLIRLRRHNQVYLEYQQIKDSIQQKNINNNNDDNNNADDDEKHKKKDFLNT